MMRVRVLSFLLIAAAQAWLAHRPIYSRRGAVQLASLGRADREGLEAGDHWRCERVGGAARAAIFRRA